MTHEEPDIDSLRSWIGRSEWADDVVTPQQIKALRVTLGYPQEGPAPLALHWCLARPTVGAADISADGHAVGATFLPPMPFPRRMWAGGSLVVFDRLQPGDSVERVSRLADITLKQGSSGPLCFLTVEHKISTGRGIAVEERQDLVYRPAPGLNIEKAAVAAKTSETFDIAKASRTLDANSVLLFRYSALTFNSHRIHYDHPYAVDVEGYEGLVVHGPLQASLLLELAADQHNGQPPKKFNFRAVKPVFEGALKLYMKPASNGLELWTSGPDGKAAMRASASW